jgi:pyruvate dehydrogenase E1 component
VAYDPTFTYELAVIIQDGMRRMLTEQENVYYYITVMNENYTHSALPEGVEDGILKGLYRLSQGPAGKTQRVQLLGSGTILREVMAAAELLAEDWDVGADVWSATSLTELHRDGVDCERWNMLHPQEKPRVPYVTQCLQDGQGPVIAATDYVRTYAEQVRAHVPRRYVTLGTDGFGRSDTRKNLRRFFEVDRWYVTVAALKALADDGAIPAGKVSEAIRKYGIDPEKPNPVTV